LGSNVALLKRALPLDIHGIGGMVTNLHNIHIFTPFRISFIFYWFRSAVRRRPVRIVKM
jgi:hypothetical protein